MFFRDQTPTPNTASNSLPDTQKDAVPEDRAYLDVPFSEKNDAKALGARWDNAKRMWYAPNNESALLERWGASARQLTSLDGEDRQFGGDGLCIEFAPRSCWCKKIRYALERDEVSRVQDLVFGRVNRTCEICSVQDLDKPYQMHGRWEYDKQTGTQTLKRLVSMCQDCFDVTHFGATSYAGRRDHAVVHWMKVTGRTEMECQAHIEQAYAAVKELNEQEWTIDLSLLTNNGLKCASPNSGAAMYRGGKGQQERSKRPPTTVHRSNAPRTVHKEDTESKPRSLFSFRGS